MPRTKPVKRLISRLAAPLGRRPDFLIIGAMKCGTCSLYEYLKAHPDVGVSVPKEVHYFDDSFERGEQWYLSHFPKRLIGQGGRVTRCCEASPYYLFDPEVPARVKSVYPDLQSIVLLRDPVARAWSHYNHSLRNGVEDRTFEQAIDAELAHLEDPENHPIHPTHEHAYAARRLRSISRGFYADQLSRWHEHFDRSKILVLRSESMFADPQAVYSEVLGWLDLPDRQLDQFIVRNRGSYKKKLDPAIRDRLREIYKPHNRRLEELLGYSMDWGY